AVARGLILLRKDQREAAAAQMDQAINAATKDGNNDRVQMLSEVARLLVAAGDAPRLQRLVQLARPDYMETVVLERVVDRLGRQDDRDGMIRLLGMVDSLRWERLKTAVRVRVVRHLSRAEDL